MSNKYTILSCGCFSLSIIFLFVGLARIAAAQTSTYGSGDFGTWVIDNHGLPSFAVNSSMNDKLGQVAYFTHQIGNDRVVALTTDGTVSLRQDEGGPKLLNDYVAEDAQIRGGFGFVNAGKNVLVSSRFENASTFRPKNLTQKFSHTLGIGYYRKQSTDHGATVDEAVIAPFGDEPVLFIQSTVTNEEIEESVDDLFYTMYFGDRLLQLSQGTNHSAYGALVRSNISTYTSPGGFPISAKGLLAMHVLPSGIPRSESSSGGPRPPPTLDDPQPRPTFLVSLGAELHGWATSGKAFFGTPIDIAKPAMLQTGQLDNSTADMERDAMLTLSVGLPALARQQNHTLYFLYGYLPNANGTDLHNATQRTRQPPSSIHQRR